MQYLKKAHSNMLQRFISGAILGLVFISSILFFSPLFYILILLTAVGMLYEWYELTKNNLTHLSLGLIIITLPIASLILVNYSGNRWLLLGYFMLIWSVDSFAMFGGKMIGGYRLASRISPKKTWSGLATGVLASIIILNMLNILIDFKIQKYYELSIIHFSLLIAFVAVMAQISDLFVSCFKRYHKIKDSGNIIAGHGGVLDRFDSIILTAPILCYSVYFL